MTVFNKANAGKKYSSEKSVCKKVVVMAGGTGGHVFPALAVAEELRARGVEVSWLGTRRGIEAELVPERGFAIDFLSVEGLRGSGIKRLIKAPFMLLIAISQALTVLRQKQPDSVLGLGGFASGPGGVAAWLLRKPLVIHEQNAIAGTTNKLLAKIARRVMVAFPGALPTGEWCGNPVRNSLAALADPAERIAQGDSKPRLLVLGGSLGALAINELMPQALAMFEASELPEVRHQCGARHLDAARKAYQQAGVEAQVEPFIKDMAAAYGWADYVVCRAGALTVSELASAGVGALLIPYPYAIDDHQTRNAEWLVGSGAATLIQQSNLTAVALFQHLQSQLADSALLRQQGRLARTLAKNDAAEVVADVCEEVCNVR